MRYFSLFVGVLDRRSLCCAYCDASAGALVPTCSGKTEERKVLGNGCTRIVFARGIGNEHLLFRFLAIVEFSVLPLCFGLFLEWGEEGRLSI